VFTNNSWSIFGLIIGSTFAGWAADKIGGGRAYAIGSVAMLLVSGAFYMSLNAGSQSVWTLYIIGGFLIGTITLGPYIIVKSFPPEVRFTGFALSYNTAYAIFGGTAPAIASFMVGRQGFTMAPAWYIGALCVLGAVIGLTWRGPVQAESTAAH
jgi:MFS family permease